MGRNVHGFDFNRYKYSVRNIKSINIKSSLHTSTLSGTSHYGDTIDTQRSRVHLESSKTVCHGNNIRAKSGALCSVHLTEMVTFSHHATNMIGGATV